MINPDVNKYTLNPALSGGLKSPSSLNDFDQLPMHHHHSMGSNNHHSMYGESMAPHHMMMNIQPDAVKSTDLIDLTLMKDNSMERPVSVSKKCRRLNSDESSSTVHNGSSDFEANLSSGVSVDSEVSSPNKLPGKNRSSTKLKSKQHGSKVSKSGLAGKMSKSGKSSKLDENNTNTLISMGCGSDPFMSQTAGGMSSSLASSTSSNNSNNGCGGKNTNQNSGLQSILVDSPISTASSASPPNFTTQLYSSQNVSLGRNSNLLHKQSKSPPTPTLTPIMVNSTSTGGSSSSGNNNTNAFVYQTSRQPSCYSNGGVLVQQQPQQMTSNMYTTGQMYQPNITLDYGSMANGGYMTSTQSAPATTSFPSVPAYPGQYMASDDYYTSLGGFGVVNNSNGHFSNKNSKYVFV
jgi:hypothetical protein